MSILTDLEIESGIQNESILIEPFNPDRLQNCSYDVSLGSQFYRETPGIPSQDGSSLFNIWSEKEVRKVYQPGQWIGKKELQTKYQQDFDNLPEDVRVILISPGETILGHTEEFIGGIQGVTTQMFCRSSIGRCGISICRCAGWGDAGYINRWTMEISNANKHNTVPLIIGEPIAQIVFIKLNSEPKFSYGTKGNYQSGTYLVNGKVDLEALKASWNPQQMLPKLYRRFPE